MKKFIEIIHVFGLLLLFALGEMLLPLLLALAFMGGMYQSVPPTPHVEKYPMIEQVDLEGRTDLFIFSELK